MSKICPACWQSRLYWADLWKDERLPRIKWYPDVYFPRLGHVGFQISWIHSPQGHRGAGLSIQIGWGLLAIHFGD